MSTYDGSSSSQMEEIQQIEEWTQMKIGNIIFDSDVDNWKQNSSVFDRKILNKSNLIFLIEDEVGNLFGGYVSSIIHKIAVDIKDTKSFLFSLKSKGRLNQMLKFEIIYQQYAFIMYPKYSQWLFLFGCGNDICVYKESENENSLCNQASYNYNNIKYTLCGKKQFEPIRIAVIQMV